MVREYIVTESIYFIFYCSGIPLQKTGIAVVKGLEAASAIDKGMQPFDELKIIS